MGMTLADKETASINAQVKEELRRVKAHKAEVKKRLEEGPKMKVEFQNNEDPPGTGQPSPEVKFDYNGIKYTVKHGDVVEWPEEVVHHVNSLTTPVYSNETDPITGALRSSRTGTLRRFMCLPVIESRGGITRGAPKKEKVIG